MQDIIPIFHRIHLGASYIHTPILHPCIQHELKNQIKMYTKSKIKKAHNFIVPRAVLGPFKVPNCLGLSYINKLFIIHQSSQGFKAYQRWLTKGLNFLNIKIKQDPYIFCSAPFYSTVSLEQKVQAHRDDNDLAKYFFT